MPGEDWVRNFLKRHKDILTERRCANITAKRSEIGKADIEAFIDNLSKTLEGVEPQHIINYDETNIVDNPGKIKRIYRRGSKKNEKVLNTSKSAVSVMFATTATGKILPPYVVYKGKRMMDTYAMG